MASRTASCSSLKPDVSISFLRGVTEKGRTVHLAMRGAVLRCDERREAERNEEKRFLAMMKEN
jgi:hypothetical protein